VATAVSCLSRLCPDNPPCQFQHYPNRALGFAFASRLPTRPDVPPNGSASRRRWFQISPPSPSCAFQLFELQPISRRFWLGVEEVRQFKVVGNSRAGAQQCRNRARVSPLSKVLKGVEPKMVMVGTPRERRRSALPPSSQSEVIEGVIIARRVEVKVISCRRGVSANPCEPMCNAP
jgi:hypothetical protein